MSLSSFVSDELFEAEENQSYFNFSMETSNIIHHSRISTFSNPQSQTNLKHLQSLLFQTNFFLQKLEEKMNETLRTIDVEVFIRQLRSHQTVLSLKVNSDNIDDSFMNFVVEKHHRLVEEVKKALEDKAEINSVSQVTPKYAIENLDTSAPQITPAFSAAKNFSFKDSESCDKEISSKINELLVQLMSSQCEELFEDSFFRMRFPRVSESLTRICEVVGEIRKNKRRERMQGISERVDKSSSECMSNETLQNEVKKSLALQELHLNLSFLKNKPQEKVSERLSCCTQTSEPLPNPEFYCKKVEMLETQLKNLQDLLSEMKSEKDTIEKYQKQLVLHISDNKLQDTSESTVFYKERYENANRHLIHLQEQYKKLTNKNKFPTVNLEKIIIRNS